jgi:hypothetical protein
MLYHKNFGIKLPLTIDFYMKKKFMGFLFYFCILGQYRIFYLILNKKIKIQPGRIQFQKMAWLVKN